MAPGPRTGWPRRHGWLLVDLVFAAVLVCAAGVSLVGSGAGPQPWTPLVGGLWMAFLALRSTGPFVAVLGTAAGALAYATLSGAPDEGGLWSFLAVLVIAFTAGSRLTGRRRWIGVAALLVCGYVLQIATGLHDPRQSVPDTYLTPTILIGLPFLAGLLLQRARRQTAELRRLQTELEAEREAHAAAAAAQERTRIARELHDVISHSVSVMVVQAGAAELQLPPDSPARPQLHAVRQTGKQALVELRRQLGVLRTDDPRTGPAPIPTLTDLGQLGGAGVEIVCDPASIGDLPPGLAQTVYRLAQEAITNARRHAAGAPVRVAVTRSGDELALEVVNGAGARVPELAAGGTGHGIRGMTERVELYAGRLETGATPDGGWRVSARLPVQAAGIAS